MVNARAVVATATARNLPSPSTFTAPQQPLAVSRPVAPRPVPIAPVAPEAPTSTSQSDFAPESETVRSPAPSSTLRLQVARNLLLARSALRLTQDQVSEASGISRATIAQIEGAIADCRLSTINEIARALRICPLILLLRESDTANLLKHMLRSSVDDVLRHASPAKVRQMQQLKQTGLPRALVRVAQQGAEIARAAGYTNASSQVAAGIGSVHQPGTGTAVGTIFGAMVDGQGVLRDAYDHGGGI